MRKKHVFGSIFAVLLVIVCIAPIAYVEPYL